MKRFVHTLLDIEAFKLSRFKAFGMFIYFRLVALKWCIKIWWYERDLRKIKRKIELNKQYGKLGDKQ